MLKIREGVGEISGSIKEAFTYYRLVILKLSCLKQRMV